MLVWVTYELCVYPYVNSQVDPLTEKYTICNSRSSIKAQSHIQSRTSSARKHEQFWFVCCDSLGVRQKSLINLRERAMNVIHRQKKVRPAPV